MREEIDQRVKVFLDRPIEGDWPYLRIDATYLKVRQAGRIVSVAVIVAVGVNTDGRREVLGMDIGPSEAETFWTAFLCKRRDALDATRALLAMRRPGQRDNLPLHPMLGGEGDHLAQKIGVGRLLHERAQVHHWVGHRWCPQVLSWSSQPDPDPEIADDRRKAPPSLRR